MKTSVLPATPSNKNKQLSLIDMEIKEQRFLNNMIKRNIKLGAKLFTYDKRIICIVGQ